MLPKSHVQYIVLVLKLPLLIPFLYCWSWDLEYMKMSLWVLHKVTGILCGGVKWMTKGTNNSFYFSQVLEGITGGKQLWENWANLSQMKWMMQLLKVLSGSSKESATLRVISFRYYRGTEILSLQNWSGVDQHLAQVQVDFFLTLFLWMRWGVMLFWRFLMLWFLKNKTPGYLYFVH